MKSSRFPALGGPLLWEICVCAVGLGRGATGWGWEAAGGRLAPGGAEVTVPK